MALLKSGNPTLTEKIFNTTISDQQQGTMTARGAMNKFGFLFLMVIAGAAFNWHLYSQGKSSNDGSPDVGGRFWWFDHRACHHF